MVMAAALSAPVALAAEPTNFKIPAQPMKTALPIFAKQSGIQLLFPYDQVAGLHAQSVNGKMAPDVALQRLIAGSGLKITLSNSSVIALSLSHQAQKSRAVEVASLGVTALPFAMQAAALPQAAAAETEGDAGETIVVTGSRGQARTITDSPTPIDVISGADLNRTGKAGVFQALIIIDQLSYQSFFFGCGAGDDGVVHIGMDGIGGGLSDGK